MDLSTNRPLGDRTTVLDIADRDVLDNTLFPLEASDTYFTRDQTRRVLPFTPVIQEFPVKGQATFGGRVVFEIDATQCGDLLMGLMVQLKLGSWLSPDVIAYLQSGTYNYQRPDDAFYYANSLGTTLFSYAEFQLNDQLIERIEDPFFHVYSLLYPDINHQFAVGTYAYGNYSIPTLRAWDSKQVYPTCDGMISCILPFHFLRTPLKNGFPLLSVKDGNLRLVLQIRPFEEMVRKRGGSRISCDETPLGKELKFWDTSVPWYPGLEVVRNTQDVQPGFEDFRLVTYGMLTDGKFRNALLRAPFQRMYRSIVQFNFAEPLKYVVNKTSNDVINLVLPLELNHPVEEIYWVIRRKAVNINNEWTNFSGVLEKEYSNIYNPLEGMCVYAALQANGSTLVEDNGDYFRRVVNERHKGGIISYNNFVYGYCFALHPDKHNPSGWLNASRTSDMRLRLSVKPPGGVEDLEWEVFVFASTLQWIRFENGIANKLFSS